MPTPEVTFLFKEKAQAALCDEIEQICAPLASFFGVEKQRNLSCLSTQRSCTGALLCKNILSKMETKKGALLSLILLRAFAKATLALSPTKTLPFFILKEEAEQGLAELFDLLQKQKRSLISQEEITSFAIKAAEDSSFVGMHISQALGQVGKSGPIFFETSLESSATLEILNVLEWEGGYESSYFCTDPVAELCSLQHPKILLASQPIESVYDILPLVETFSYPSAPPLCLFVEKISEEALSSLIVNQLQGLVNLCVIPLCQTAKQKREKELLLEKLSKATGASIFEKQLDFENNNVFSRLGNAKKILVTSEKTFLFGVQDTPSINLQRGAILHVHQEDLLAFTSCLEQTQKATQEGIILGSGVELWHAAQELRKVTKLSQDSLSLALVIQAAEAPLTQFLLNQEIESSSFLNVLKSAEGKKSVDVETFAIEDKQALSRLDLYEPLSEVKQAFIIALEQICHLWSCGALISPAKLKK